ncbi:MAG TPA: lipid-A-disaccharide synthase [bacterium]|nr:lipid-A-disaccharide synthase [bacterium]
MSGSKIFISAGELSGDIHGSNLVEALLKIDNALQINAIGGDNMEKAGASLLHHINETSVMGITEVIKILPRIYRIWRSTKSFIKKTRPDLIITIDYPGFNLRLAKFAAKQNIPVIYYISPKIWAWHESRIKKIRKYVDEMLCILPFEEKWYEKRGVTTTFVGNPLIDRYEPVRTAQTVNKPITNPEIGLLPGSRAQEINSLLPEMIASIKNLKNRYPNIGATVAMAPGFDFTDFQQKYSYPWLNWEEGNNELIMKNSDLLIVASGTAVLEATILNTPSIVIYKVAPFTYWFGRLFVNIDHISLPNIIAGKEVLPELIQNEVQADKISKKALDILNNPDRNVALRQQLAEITQSLGKKGVAERAARIIYNRIQ